MTQQIEALWTVLHHAGLVSGKLPVSGEPESPWYVKVLLIISGWLAALFILGFIGTGFYFVFKTSIAAFTIGLFMILGAFTILRIAGNEFTEHLGLAFSLTGQSLVVFALFRFSDRHESIAWLLTSLLEVPLAIFMPSFVHRIFSSFAAAFALTMTLPFIGGPNIISSAVMFGAAWCWLNEFSYPKKIKTIQAIGYGLVLALMLQKGTALFGYRVLGLYLHQAQTGFWLTPWIGIVLNTFVMLFVALRLLKGYSIPLDGRPTIFTLLGILLVCAISVKVQGVTVGLLILALGFSNSNRMLMGLGITSLLFFISSYYYLLDETFLTKSVNLLAVGLVLLLLRLFMRSFLFENKEAEDV